MSGHRLRLVGEGSGKELPCPGEFGSHEAEAEADLFGEERIDDEDWRLQGRKVREDLAVLGFGLMRARHNCSNHIVDGEEEDDGGPNCSLEEGELLLVDRSIELGLGQVVVHDQTVAHVEIWQDHIHHFLLHLQQCLVAVGH